ncbi:hypothetical protein [Methylobacterium sp. CM6257]
MCAERIAWGQTLFCDDIRHELGNKLSIIGIYQSDFIVNADFPLMIPKFCLYVSYYEIAGRLKEELQLNIFFPADYANPAFQVNIPRPAIPEQVVQQDQAEAERVNIIRAPVIFSPLQIMEQGSIKVRMTCGDYITKLGIINIRKASDAEIGMFFNVPSQQPAPPPPGSPES